MMRSSLLALPIALVAGLGAGVAVAGGGGEDADAAPAGLAAGDRLERVTAPGVGAVKLPGLVVPRKTTPTTTGSNPPPTTGRTEPPPTTTGTNPPPTRTESQPPPQKKDPELKIGPGEEQQ